jgi:hypothetical protein
MYSATESQSIKDRAAIQLLVFKMKSRLAQGYDTLLLSDVNDVLMVADGEIVEPLSKKELEVL